MSTQDEEVAIRPSSTSYFSDPDASLDPALFEGHHLRGSVRAWVLNQIRPWMQQRYAAVDVWLTVWIAGSGASYQWSAAREPGDLDVLLGMEYVAFRRANPGYAGLSDEEISSYINDQMKSSLWPETAEAVVGGKRFEVTWYINPQSTDIRSINPYAAYNVTADQWTVTPVVGVHPPVNEEWLRKSQADEVKAQGIVQDYNRALRHVGERASTAAIRNALIWQQQAEAKAKALFDEIHLGRHAAFAPGGQGYGDWHNYRWQSGKRSGAVQALGEIRRRRAERDAAQEQALYGTNLTSAQMLTVRAAMHRSTR